VREAVFSAVAARIGDFGGIAVLDAFAGSGALAFEALSRGADRAVLIESDRQAMETIARNAETLGCAGKVSVSGGDSFRVASGSVRGGPFALLFLDPPYRIVPTQVSQLMEDLAKNGSLEVGALVVYEHASREVPVWPEGYAAAGDRMYGTTAISYATYEGKQPT